MKLYKGMVHAYCLGDPSTCCDLCVDAMVASLTNFTVVPTDLFNRAVNMS